MAKKKVADLLVDVLAEAGVRRIYGVSGDSLNGITDSIRATGQLDWIHLRHEEVAAFAAGAEANQGSIRSGAAPSTEPGQALSLPRRRCDVHQQGGDDESERQENARGLGEPAG